MAILLSEKIDFKAKSATKDREVHFPIIKVPINQENNTIINIHTTNYRAPTYMKQKLSDMKTRQLDNSSWRCQYPAVNNEHKMRQRIKK